MYIPIWGLLLLDADTCNNFSIFVGMVYSILSVFFIKNTEIFKSVRFAFIYLLLFPFFYLFLSIILAEKEYYSFLDPILWAFVMLLVGIYFLKSTNFKEMFIICFVSYFYGFHIYPTYKNLRDRNLLNINQIEEKDLNFDKKLVDYKFENSKKDTISLKSNKPFTLVETWNESCAPCIAAMSDLQPLMENLSSKVDHYYLYENGGTKLYGTKTKIFNYSHIKDKSKILMDVENKFFKDSKMASFPYFLLFDKEGNLIDYFKGYNPKHKDYFDKRLQKMMNPVRDSIN